mgnify:FL=1
MMKGSRTAMNNRRFIRIQLLLLFILLLACCIWSCSGKQDAPDGTASAGATSVLPDTGSETKAEPETASENAPATETETETETATETVTEPETSFNEGKVDYAIVDGTVIATPQDGYSLGLDITDRTDLIGICYTMWFNAIHGDGEGKLEGCLNVEELIAQYGFSAKYGFGNEKEQHNHLHQFHYWSEPAQGYYRSTDTDAIRNNMTLLYNAGVDFLILDYTYAGAGYQPGSSEWTNYISKPMNALLDTIMQMRAEGLGTPYVVMWMNDDSLFDAIYQSFYSVEKWTDCFVFWNDKPFIMRWNAGLDDIDTKYFTVRGMSGLHGASTAQWSYLQANNKRTVSYFGDDPEHVSVCVAAQLSYMSDPHSANGRAGGVFWYSQWLTAFKIHPKIVSVTWWNEWTAQLYYFDSPGYVFTDNFNQEYSRDIEPMKGGHGDQYYRWLCEYIRAYRAGEECPVLVEPGYESKAARALRLFLR